jgi:type IV pilus assembly protein PilA
VIDKVKKSGRRRVIVLTTAVVLAIGLVWVFFGGMSDKEGRIKVALAMVKAREAQSAIAAYYVERKVLPPDNSALRLPNRESKPYFTAFEQQADLSFGILVQRGTLTLTFASQQDPVSGKTLVFVPRVADGGLEWTCNTGTVDPRYRPPQCRGQ